VVCEIFYDLPVFPGQNLESMKGLKTAYPLMALCGSIPSFIKITDGKVHNTNVLDDLIPELGSCHVIDRGYLDFARLYNLTVCLAFFVIRSKTNLKSRRIYSHPIDKSLGLICDQTIVLSNADSEKDYLEKLRRVNYAITMLKIRKIICYHFRI